jgi:hypothetical protein
VIIPTPCHGLPSGCGWRYVTEDLRYGWILWNLGKGKWMRLGTWNVRSLDREGSLQTVASELAKYRLYLVQYKQSDGIMVLESQQVLIKF